MGAQSPVKNVQWLGDGGRTALVQAAGDIDLRCSSEFQRRLLEVVEAKPRGIVVDLSEVPYMDSSGVASLVKLLARVRRGDIKLRLCGLNPRVRSVFEITRLDGVFEIRPTAKEAMEA